MNWWIKCALGKTMAVTVAALFVAGILGAGLFQAKTDFTFRSWLDNDSPQVRAREDFEKRFGGDQAVILGVHSEKSFLEPGQIQIIRDLEEKMWTLPDVVAVETYANTNVIELEGGDINIFPFHDQEQSPSTFRERLLSNRPLFESMLSDREDLALVIAKVKPFYDEELEFERNMEPLNKILEESAALNPGLKFLHLGSVNMSSFFRQTSEKDNQKILPFLFLFITLLLGLVFRSVAAVVVSWAVVGASILSTFGLMGHLGIAYNNILTAIPGIILTIGLADSIHILTSFYQNRGQMGDEAALEKSLKDNFSPTMLTTITTALSFMTFLFSDLVPLRDLGLLTGCGAFLAWGYSYIFCSAGLKYLPKWALNQRKKPFLPFSFDSASEKHSRFVQKRAVKITVAFSIFSALCLWQATKVEVNSDPVKYFSHDTQIRKDYEFAKQKLSGFKGINIQVKSHEPEGIKNPEFLAKLDAFEKELEKIPEIDSIQSILYPLKKINQFFSEKEGLALPANTEAAAQALLLFSLGSGDRGQQDLVSMDEKFVRMFARWTVENSNDATKLENQIHKLARDMDLDAATAGNMPIFISINKKVADTFLTSFTLILFIVSGLFYWRHRSLLAASLAILPNLFPICAGAGLMGWWGVNLDIGTSIASAVCLGIAVDDTIHFLSHYLKNRAQAPFSEAMTQTLKSTGKALSVTTLLLFFGFGSFYFSDFLPTHYFGILCAITLTAALACDLILLPALLFLFEKNVDKKTEGTHELPKAV